MSFDRLKKKLPSSMFPKYQLKVHLIKVEKSFDTSSSLIWSKPEQGALVFKQWRDYCDTDGCKQVV